MTSPSPAVAAGSATDLSSASSSSPAVRRIAVTVSDDARTWLAETGFDPAYGARPLRRLIQTAIGDPLAKLLISGEVVDGGTVQVDLAEGREGLTLTPA